MSESSPPSFETALKQLEAKVRQLESGEVPLDAAIALFEEGMALSKLCHTQLEAAQDRISRLVQGASGVETVPLAEDGGDAPGEVPF